jgi:hypothetical protein
MPTEITYDRAPTLAMIRLRSRIQPEILALMEAADRSGADYITTALEVVATLAEEQAQLLACIIGPQDRQKAVDQLFDRMREAVETAHTKAAARSGIGGRA